MDALAYATVIAALALLWGLIASPILLSFFFLCRAMRRRGPVSIFFIVCIALAFALLAAPVPTPIITIFFPFGYTLFDPEYLRQAFGDHPMFSQLRPWILNSVGLSFALALPGFWLWLRWSLVRSRQIPR